MEFSSDLHRLRIIRAEIMKHNDGLLDCMKRLEEEGSIDATKIPVFSKEMEALSANLDKAIGVIFCEEFDKQQDSTEVAKT